jgi:hypothetical protein
MIFPQKQLLAVLEWLKEIEPKNEMGDRIRVQELEI